MQCGVDANAMDRTLLLSSKPYLHLNVDCNAIVAAIVSRQLSVVELLLKVITLCNIMFRIDVEGFLFSNKIALYANNKFTCCRRVSGQTLKLD